MPLNLFWGKCLQLTVEVVLLPQGNFKPSVVNVSATSQRRIGEALTDTKAASPFWKTVTIWVIMNMFYEINRCTVKSSLMFSAETSLSYSDNVHVLMIHLTIQKRGMQLKYENKLQNLHSTLLQPAFESPEFSCLDKGALLWTTG